MYRLTEEGRDAAETWLVIMLRTVRNEYPDFPAALSFLPLLSADEARSQLTARLLLLGREIAALRSGSEDLRERYGMPRLFTIEDEYRLAMLEAEHRWVGRVVQNLASGELYWDAGTITAWAEGLSGTVEAFPGIPLATDPPDGPVQRNHSPAVRAGSVADPGGNPGVNLTGLESPGTTRKVCRFHRRAGGCCRAGPRRGAARFRRGLHRCHATDDVGADRRGRAGGGSGAVRPVGDAGGGSRRGGHPLVRQVDTCLPWPGG